MKNDPPPAPDYAALAQQQGATNLETARAMGQINRPNEYTPYGSREWTVDPNNPDKYILTSTLSPDEQAKLDMSNQLSMLLMGAGQMYGMPALTKALQADFTPVRDAQIGWENDYAPDQRLQTESGFWELPWIQEQLDYSGAPELRSDIDTSGVLDIPNPDSKMRRRLEESLYGSATRWLDPMFANQQNRLDTRLSNQGIFTGSEAHRDAQQELDDQETKAYADARDRAIAMGGDEMARQFGMGLDAHRTGFSDASQEAAFRNAARGQYTGEEDTKAGFANQARGQLASELWQDQANRNNAILQQGNIGSAQQNAANSGLQAWLAQKTQSATMPINVMSALMSGGQVNNPQWQPYNNSINVDPAPVFQAGVAQYGANMNNYNAKQAQTQNWMNLAGGLAGSAFMGGWKPWAP